MDASSSSSRVLSSLSSSTSSCSLDTRSFHRLRFCLPQRKLVQVELRRPAKFVDNSRFSFSGLSVRCRVIRDVRDEALVSIFQGERPSLPTTRYWPGGEVSDTREAVTLLPCDDYKEERLNGYANKSGDRIEIYREDSTLVCIDDEDELEEESSDQTSLPLDSRVEILEGIPVWQWLSTFVGSINPRLRGIIILNALTLLYGTIPYPAS